MEEIQSNAQEIQDIAHIIQFYAHTLQQNTRHNNFVRINTIYCALNTI